MKHSMNMIKKLFSACLLGLLLICQSACISSPSGNIGMLPQEEIVFQTITDEMSFEDPGRKGLGFVNAEGGVVYSDLNQAIVPPVYPMYTSDNALFVFNAPYVYGRMATADIDGKIKALYPPHGVLRHITPIDGTHEAIVVTMDSGSPDIIYSLRRMDLHTGKFLETYLTTQPDRVSDPFLQIGTRVKDGQRLLFMRYYGIPRHYTVVLLNTETQQETIVLDSATRISAPAFSPDGRWIAYGGEDGVYVLEPDADEIVPRKIVTASNAIREPMSPAWSPNGEWLVYHDCLRKCDQHTPSDIEDFNIYKVNVATGERLLLVEGALDPYWRLSTEIPQ